MPDAGGHLQGDPEDFGRMLAAFEERNALATQHEATMGKLVESVTTLALSVQILRSDIAKRPTQHEIAHRRRTMLALLTSLILLTAGLGDLNAQHCGPGQRAEQSLDALAHGARDPAVIAAAGHPHSSPACDTLVPLHGHSGEGFPTRWSYLGWLLYALGACATLIYARGPRRESVSEPTDRRATDVVPPEETA